MIAILERKANISREDENFYQNLILKFCKICIILQDTFFVDTKKQNISAGIPTMACIMWGDIGHPHHSRVRPELKGEGNQGHVLSTSIPYMTFLDKNRLRTQLRRLREDDLQQALPSGVSLPVLDKSPSWGNCAEHPAVTLWVVSA